MAGKVGASATSAPALAPLGVNQGPSPGRHKQSRPPGRPPGPVAINRELITADECPTRRAPFHYLPTDVVLLGQITYQGRKAIVADGPEATRRI